MSTRLLRADRRSLLKGTAIAAVVAGLPGVGAGLAAPAWAADPPAAHVMGYFTESPSGLGNDYGLHLAVSDDGLEWIPLNQNRPVVTPTAGTRGLRDPFILRKQDGTFVVLATDLNGTDFAAQNQYIHVWDSADLTSFTGYRRIKMHSLATHSWAPEAFWDPQRGQYAIIYSAYNGTRDVILANYTTDFSTVTAWTTWFDPGAATIDASLHTHNGVNYLYFKRDNQLFGARSASLAAGAFNSSTYTTGYAGVGLTEAPIVVRSLTSSTWFLWGDVYTPVNGIFTVWSSSDIAANAWTPLSRRLYTQPLNSKHATIASLSAAEKQRLLTVFGSPTWTRLKSWSFPDRFVRHQGWRGRIDAYPLDPFTDTQWVLRPGLSGNGISLQSVTDPSRYLRHRGFEVFAEPDDRSTGFARDATFAREAGLADGSWSTLRSVNYTDRVLRHRGSQLYVEPATLASDAGTRGDATFRFTP